MVKTLRLPSTYKTESLATDIVFIKNFLTDEELKQYRSCIDSASESDWGKDYLDGLKRESLSRFGDENYEKYVAQNLMNMNQEWADKSLEVSGDLPQKISNRIVSFFNEKVSIEPLRTIQRHYPGSSLKEHIDAEHDPDLIYACVVYLNDDFNGGRLYFPNFDTTVEPEAAGLVIFPTHSEYLHGVGEVLPGPTRYAVAGFIFRDGV